ncbi:hypothetical protein UlMin_043531 [Ulmus minor]
MEASKSGELKKELQRLVKVIVDDDDYTVEDETVRVLDSLKELKFNKSLSFKLDDNEVVPEEFKCPISRELMRDPVILATGQTYDRAFIERWLNEGNRTCPQTQQVLPHTNLIPNKLVRGMIFHWCNERGIEIPRDTNVEVITKDEREYLNSLLEKLSLSQSDQKEAAKEIRMLTKKKPSSRQFFSDSPEAICKLLSPFPLADRDLEMQENIITTLFNISIFEDNKRFVVANPAAISLLIKSLKSGTIQTNANAAATLFTLAVSDNYKRAIGEAGALSSLIDLINSGHPEIINDAATAVFKLCSLHENTERACEAGAVSVILKKLNDRILVGELMAILVLLSKHIRSLYQMMSYRVVPLLLNIIKENSPENAKENAISLLYTICNEERLCLREVKVEEAKNGTISQLRNSETSTSRAKRKAKDMLERLKNTAIVPDSPNSA